MYTISQSARFAHPVLHQFQMRGFRQLQTKLQMHPSAHQHHPVVMIAGADGSGQQTMGYKRDPRPVLLYADKKDDHRDILDWQRSGMGAIYLR